MFISRHQSAGQNRDMKLEYLETTVTIKIIFMKN